MRVTTHAANDWQPTGRRTATRSRSDRNVTAAASSSCPALGGAERKLADWATGRSGVRTDRACSSCVRPFMTAGRRVQHAYLLAPDGAAPKRVLEKELASSRTWPASCGTPTGSESRSGVGGEPPTGTQFWTEPIAGGTAVQSEGSPESEKETQALGLGEMRWAPKGDALFIEAHTRGIRNLWRVDVDPATFGFTGGPVRLTTGAGIDASWRVARRHKLAFVTKSEMSRLWSIPFDSGTRRVTGEATPLTPANIWAGTFDLAANGASLAYTGVRPGARHGAVACSDSGEPSCSRSVVVTSPCAVSQWRPGRLPTPRQGQQDAMARLGHRRRQR